MVLNKRIRGLERHHQENHAFPVQERKPSFRGFPIPEFKAQERAEKKKPKPERIPKSLSGFEEVIEYLGWRADPEKRPRKAGDVGVVGIKEIFLQSANQGKRIMNARIIAPREEAFEMEKSWHPKPWYRQARVRVKRPALVQDRQSIPNPQKALMEAQ